MTKKKFDTDFESDEYRWKKAEKKILDEYYGEDGWVNKKEDEDNG